MQSGINKDLLDILKKLTQETKELSIYTGHSKYSVFLFPQKIKKYFVNKAAALNFIKYKSYCKKEDYNQIHTNGSVLFAVCAKALFVTGLIIFTAGLLSIMN